jgi:hypothetical protein
MPVTDKARGSAKMSHSSKEPGTSLSQRLAMLGGFALVGVLMWTAPLIGVILEADRLRTEGVMTNGIVTGHQQSAKKRECPFTADISFYVDGRRYRNSVYGCGAGPDKLNVGQEVPITYVPKRPDISQVRLPEARSGPRPEWWVLGVVWAIPALIFLAAWLARRCEKHKTGKVIESLLRN